MTRSRNHSLPVGSPPRLVATESSARLCMAAILGYVAGTLPSSQMATKLAGRVDLDLTNDGTGNPGGMNTSHLLGKKWGVAVTVADAGKAAAAARIGLRLAGGRGANLAATSAVIGHCYPPKRRGGKGVATSLGQVAATFPVYLPIDMAVGISTAAFPWFRQRTRVATGLASATWVSCSLIWWRRKLRNPGGVEPTVSLPAAAIVSSLVIAKRFQEEAARVDDFNRAELPIDRQDSPT